MVAEVLVDTIEGEFPCVVDVALFYRATPVVTATPLVVERMAACSGEEYRIPIRTGYLIARGAILAGPSPGALVFEFYLFGISGHAPLLAHVHIGGIVLEVEGDLVVDGAIIAITAILGQGITTAMAPFVGAPVVGVLCFSLAPGEVIALGLWTVSANIAVGPQGARGETEVNGILGKGFVIISQSVSVGLACL